MKKIDSIYDESLGGKPKEKPTTAYNMRSDACWLIYLIVLLVLLIPAAIWILYEGDPAGVYYIYLILALFILMIATFYCIMR